MIKAASVFSMPLLSISPSFIIDNVTVKLLWIIAGILILLGIRFLYEDGVLNRWIALLLTVALYFIIIRITKQLKTFSQSIYYSHDWKRITFTQSIYFLYDRKRTQAAVKKKSVDHLFIGSSMFRQGLSIDVLEEMLEGEVYILSYNGNQLYASPTSMSIPEEKLIYTIDLQFIIIITCFLLFMIKAASVFSIQNMKRIGKILAGVLFAVLLLTGIKNEYARLLPVSTYGMQAAVKKKSVDHLFIGSSMFRGRLGSAHCWL